MGQAMMAKFGTEILLVEFSDEFELGLPYLTVCPTVCPSICPLHFLIKSISYFTWGQAMVAKFGIQIHLVEF